jgi:hypothetical protein
MRQSVSKVGHDISPFNFTLIIARYTNSNLYRVNIGSAMFSLHKHSSLLRIAEGILGIGAMFGFFAVLALMIFSWSLVLIATAIAVLALMIALVLFSVPMFIRKSKHAKKTHIAIKPPE